MTDPTPQPSDPDVTADGPKLAADLVLYRDRPAELTIYPLDADEFERLTTWITADEESFFDLDATR